MLRAGGGSDQELGQAFRCGVSAVIGHRPNADKHRVSPATFDTAEPYDATRRIVLTDVPGWAGAEVSRRRALPRLPPRVTPSAEKAGDTIAHALPSRAGHAAGPRACPPLRVVTGPPNPGVATSRHPDLIDAADAATDDADLQRPQAETGRWWRRWWWRQVPRQLAPERDFGPVPSGSRAHAAEVKREGRHRHGRASSSAAPAPEHPERLAPFH